MLEFEDIQNVFWELFGFALLYAKLKDALVDQRSNGDAVFDSEEIPSIRPGKLAPSILSFEFVVSISEILSISEYGVLRFPANFKPERILH